MLKISVAQNLRKNAFIESGPHCYLFPSNVMSEVGSNHTLALVTPSLFWLKDCSMLDTLFFSFWLSEGHRAFVPPPAPPQKNNPVGKIVSEKYIQALI